MFWVPVSDHNPHGLHGIYFTPRATQFPHTTKLIRHANGCPQSLALGDRGLCRATFSWVDPHSGCPTLSALCKGWGIAKRPLSSTPNSGTVAQSKDPPHRQPAHTARLLQPPALQTIRQHLLRMPQRRLRQTSPRKHPRNLLHPLRTFHQPHPRMRPPTPLYLLNQKVLVRKRRNLRQVRNTDHLLRPA